MNLILLLHSVGLWWFAELNEYCCFSDYHTDIYLVFNMIALLGS
jgi:hypothetical protein